MIPKNKLIKINIKKSGYFNIDTLVNLSLHERSIKKERNILLEFVLRYDGQFSTEFDVTATYKPSVAFSSERISVSDFAVIDRSEEHTSELQSRPHLVCRLLLEKKK